MELTCLVPVQGEPDLLADPDDDASPARRETDALGLGVVVVGFDMWSSSFGRTRRTLAAVLG